MNPTSVQHAALRLLIEDVDPLLQRAEEATQMLMKVREELHADLATLGKLVQQTLDTQPLVLEAGRKLNASAARIEAGLMASVAPPSQARTRGTRSSGRDMPLWSACAISAALSACLVTGAIWVGAGTVLEQARVGRALMTAWPSIDGATRAKVQEQLGKS